MACVAGFDIDAAVFTLHREALAAGAIPEGDNPHPGALETARAHMHDSADQCAKSPCRTAGLCFALYELLQYRFEVQDPKGLIAAADETEIMRKALRKAGERYVQTIENLVEESEERHRRYITLGQKETKDQHEILCRLPVRALHEMTALRRTLEKLERKLRGGVASFDLQQSGDKKRGDLLLKAVYQHLRWGGMTYVEIATLVPDGGGRLKAGDRVRDRCKGADGANNARSVMPRELFDKREKYRKNLLEKQAKARSSS